MHAMFVDAAFNSLEVVAANLFAGFREAALRMLSYLRCLPAAKRPSTKLIVGKLHFPFYLREISFSVPFLLEARLRNTVEADQNVSSGLRRETDLIACIDTIESLARLSWRLIQRKGGEKGELVDKELWLLGALNANEVVSQFRPNFTLYYFSTLKFVEIPAHRGVNTLYCKPARRSTMCFRVVAHGGHFCNWLCEQQQRAWPKSLKDAKLLQKVVMT